MYVLGSTPLLVEKLKAITSPFMSPKQPVTAPGAIVYGSMGTGATKDTELVETQPLLSVTVAVYVPAPKPAAVVAVASPFVQR
jgi:hypothetical protein